MIKIHTAILLIAFSVPLIGCEQQKNHPGQVELNINIKDPIVVPENEGNLEKAGKQIDQTLDKIGNVIEDEIDATSKVFNDTIKSNDDSSK